MTKKKIEKWLAKNTKTVVGNLFTDTYWVDMRGSDPVLDGYGDSFKYVIRYRNTNEVKTHARNLQELKEAVEYIMQVLKNGLAENKLCEG